MIPGAAMSTTVSPKPLEKNAVMAGDIIISGESVAVSHSAVCIWEDQIAHSMGGTPVLGALEDFGKDKATVYRANPDLAYVDTALLWRVCQALAPKVKYGTSLPALVFGSASYGSGAAAWVADMRTRYVNGEFATKDQQGQMANLVCSQSVVLVLQLALGEKHASFIKLDGRYTLPKTLRAYLTAPGSNWRVVGPFSRRYITLGDLGETKM
jgi:hypothetical protein